MKVEEGWEYFEQKESKRLQPKDIDIVYGKVFKSEEGQKVLSHLRAITIEQPTWYPGEDSSFGYVREGMADLVRQIEKRVARSSNG
jgi:hypothetical protein